jgi:hypothetical protein
MKVICNFPAISGSGVHQAVAIWEQLTDKTGAGQINIPAEKPCGISINMGTAM